MFVILQENVVFQQHPAPIPPSMPAGHAMPAPGVTVGSVGAVGTVTTVSGVSAVGGVSATVGPPALPPAQLRRLLAAYRVGMLALETQARRVHDDRPQNKFGRYEKALL